MGMLDNIPFVSSGKRIIDEPSKLLCYTDGLTELIDGREISFGTKEIEEGIINDNTIEDNISQIIQKQGINTDSQAIFDDISILGIEFF